MHNIPTIVGITQRGCSCECGIYAKLILMDLNIYTESFCSGYRQCKITIWKEDTIGVVESLF